MQVFFGVIQISISRLQSVEENLRFQRDAKRKKEKNLSLTRLEFTQNRERILHINL